MILDPGFPTHPKTEEVDREIGPIGVVAVVTLFCFAHSTKRWEWRFESREQLLKKFKAMTRTWALIEPEQLLSVLGDTFLDLDEDGLGFQIHDFEEHNWKLVRAWRNAKKSADVRKAKREDSSSELKPKKAAPSSKLKSKKTSTSSELKPKNGPPSSERKGREGKGREGKGKEIPPLTPPLGGTDGRNDFQEGFEPETASANNSDLGPGTAPDLGPAAQAEQLANSFRNAKGVHLSPPTLEQVISMGVQVGVPPDLCEDFFDYFSTRGWKQGQHATAPITDLRRRLKGWKRTADKRERTEEMRRNGPATPTTPEGRKAELAKQIGKLTGGKR